MPDLQSKDIVSLEDMVDQYGLNSVLQSLSLICAEKAEHIQSSYSDAQLARLWGTASGVIGVTSAHKSVSAISID